MHDSFIHWEMIKTFEGVHLMPCRFWEDVGLSPASAAAPCALNRSGRLQLEAYCLETQWHHWSSQLEAVVRLKVSASSNRSYAVSSNVLWFFSMDFPKLKPTFRSAADPGIWVAKLIDRVACPVQS